MSVLFYIADHEEQQLGFERLILPVTDGVVSLQNVCHLNATAANLWDLLKNSVNGCSIENLAEYLESHYRVNHNRALCDATNFIHTLLEFNLVIEVSK